MAIPTPANVRLRRALKLLDQMVFAIIANARKAEEEKRPTLLSMLLHARDADTGSASVPPLIEPWTA